MVFSKFKEQWKSVSKAFNQINRDYTSKSGISKEEFTHYLEHWGFKLNDDQFEYLFSKFD